jgi:serine/threonine-protein kinase HipA
MNEITNCPGTLTEGFNTYSSTCLKRVFNGKKVYHILPYDSPLMNQKTNKIFDENRAIMSISGVQEKYSVILDKNKLRLLHQNEYGTHILKPKPSAGTKRDQMPANEHLTMQVARQIYGIETAENALIFFQNGAHAYITKRFDVQKDGRKLAQEDFASLAGRSPQTHGVHFKYLGNYFELFELMQKHLPAYKLEAPKLLKLLLFNYLFSNGDAHYKNFSIIETPLGDYKLSPAYDLLNSRIHVDDKEFALIDGLLPRSMAKGKIAAQFHTLSNEAGIHSGIFYKILAHMLSQSLYVKKLVAASFLNEKTKRNYWQAYETRLKQLLKS